MPYIGQARDTLEKVLHVDGTHLQVLLDKVKKKVNLFLNVDRSFAVEIAVMEAMLGPQGDAIMETKIDECFPTEANPYTLDETHTKLVALQGGQMAQVTGVQAGQTLSAVVEIIVGMKRGEAPQRQFFTSPFMQKLQPKLDFFCQYRATKDGKETLILGKAACAAKLQDLMKKFAKETITFKDLEEVHCFEWLVQGQVNKDKLKEMSESLLASAKVATKDPKKRASKASRDAAQAKGSASTDSPAGTLADVMALFS